MRNITVTTSWDDGHVLDIKLAGLLKRYNIKGTFYISPQNREFKKSDLLDGGQIKLLSDDFEIGAHTMTHPRLAEIGAAAADKEIAESKRYLEEVLQKPVMSFCYPGGSYNKINIKQVEENHFILARTVKGFFFNVGKNPFEMPTSIHAYDHWSDIWNVAKFVNFNPIRFVKCFHRWDALAIEMFDRVNREGGVFHLWGHSWEIDRYKDWDRLEKVLRYISGHENVTYATNRDLI